MHVYSIIAKKRDGQALAEDEIRYIVSAFTAGSVPDYQMSAFLMAVFLRGMSRGETAFLTRAMLESGRRLDLSRVGGPTADKHSTGGVGDGTSLAVAPLAACVGVRVPMMSGRCLGHTGGTLDKLESIPGFRTCLSTEEFLDLLEKNGVAMTGQTDDVAPADRRMYALRDVTATVESIPLIAASIMSKKIAEGTSALILDVKTGSGAFMKDAASARTLARAMKAIGDDCGLKTSACITDMNQPLGRAVGNALEVRQSIETLRNEGPADFTELSVLLAARMAALCGAAKNDSIAREQVLAALRNGAALEKFRVMVAAQGGDPRVVDDPDGVLPMAGTVEEIAAPCSGFITAIDTTRVGIAGVLLGAGRSRKEDVIDPSAGFIVRRKLGDRVNKGEPLASAFFNRTTHKDEAVRMLAEAYTILPEPSSIPPLVHEEI